MTRFLLAANIIVLAGVVSCSGEEGSQPGGVQGDQTPSAGNNSNAGAAPGGNAGEIGGQAGGQAGAPEAGAGGGAGAAGSGGQAGAGDDPAGGADAGNGADAGTGGDAGSDAPPFDGRDPNAVNPYPGYTSDIYDSDEMWMCKPDLQHNYCIEDIADAIEAMPDGTFRPFMDELGTDHPIDCIFWYPTVNRTEDPTSLDFSDPEPMLASIRSQAARFSRVCNVYAPFYRQRSLNRGGDFELGYMDVVDSFKHYVANWSDGRSFVVYGHSQGSGHATRLINQEINDNPDLRGRLVSTLIIGGGLTASTFSNIPLCTEREQTGCAIGYHAYGAPMSLSGVRAGAACTNPGDLSGGKVLMKGGFFRASGTNYQDPLGPDFTATWGLFRDFFTAECVQAPGGGEALVIDYTDDPNDMRDHFLDLSREIGGGLHVFDYQFPLDDLVELVRAQRAAKLAEIQANL